MFTLLILSPYHTAQGCTCD